MSGYVQRCTHCQQVRGKSAFTVRPGGGREPICRWCRARFTDHEKAIGAQARTVRRLVKQEGALASKLAQVRRQLSAARGTLAAMEGAVANADRCVTERAS